MTARNRKDPAARVTLLAGIAMTCCFVAASAMLLSGLVEMQASATPHSPATTIAAIHHRRLALRSLRRRPFSLDV